MKDWLMEFSKTPVGSIVCIGAMVIVLAIIILAYTPIGTKALKRLREKADAAKTQSDKSVKEIAEFKIVVDTKVDEYKKETTEKVNLSAEELKKVETLLLGVAKNINNKNVKELVKEYEKTDIKELTIDDEKVPTKD